MAIINGDAIPIDALASSVSQNPDPQALPPIAELKRAAVDTGEKHLARMLARS